MSPPLRVPLEVLERILSFAFTPLACPSSSSPVTSKDLVAPPLGTSHLLLVSPGFRQIALPLYYHTIAIVSSLDWETFLDPEEGLLVAGEDKEERASFVKELWINVSVEAKVRIDSDHLQSALGKGQQPDRILIELQRSILPNPNHFLLFLCGSLDHPRRSLGTQYIGLSPSEKVVDLLWEVVDERLSKDFFEDGCGLELYETGKEVWGPEWEKFMYVGVERLYLETDIPTPDELTEQVVSESRVAWSLFVDPDLSPPGRVEIALDGLDMELLLRLDAIGLFPTLDQPFVVLPPAGLDLKTKEDEKSTVDTLRRDMDQLSFARQHALLFEGFSQSFWKTVRSERRGEVAELGEGWLWRKEDGTVVGLKETLEGEKVSCVALLLSLLRNRHEIDLLYTVS